MFELEGAALGHGDAALWIEGRHDLVGRRLHEQHRAVVDVAQPAVVVEWIDLQMTAVDGDCILPCRDSGQALPLPGRQVAYMVDHRVAGIDVHAHGARPIHEVEHIPTGRPRVIDRVVEHRLAFVGLGVDAQGADRSVVFDALPGAIGKIDHLAVGQHIARGFGDLSQSILGDRLGAQIVLCMLEFGTIEALCALEGHVVIENVLDIRLYLIPELWICVGIEVLRGNPLGCALGVSLLRLELRKGLGFELLDADAPLRGFGLEAVLHLFLSRRVNVGRHVRSGSGNFLIEEVFVRQGNGKSVCVFRSLYAGRFEDGAIGSIPCLD